LITYHQLEVAIRNWSETRTDIVAVIVVGSRAQTGTRIDGLSDLDLIILGTDIKPLTEDISWLAQFGEIWLARLGSGGRGDPEWMVIYEGGHKLDLLLIQLEEKTEGHSREFNFYYGKVLNRGYQFIYGESADYRVADPLILDQAISQNNEIQIKTDTLLLLSFQVVRCTLRNELWRAHLYLSQLRSELLRLFERHTHLSGITSGSDQVDTWYDGRHIEEWLTSNLMKQVPALFPGYSSSELLQCTIDCLDLLDDLIGDFQHMGVDCIWDEGHQQLSNHIRELSSSGGKLEASNPM
jgi:hypothetical protein